jgi:hypothetical protein
MFDSSKITVDKVQHWMNNCPEIEYSWFAGFLKSAIDDVARVHWWPADWDNFTSKDVIVLYDEYLNNKPPDLFSFDKLKSSVAITSNALRFDYLKSIGVSAIYFPYLHWFFSLITIRKLQLKIPRSKQPKVFNFLNRRWSSGRYHMLEYICKKYSDIIDKGYITANTFSFYQDHPGFYKDVEFLNLYLSMDKNRPVEVNNSEINGVSAGLNLKNLLHIAKTVPGSISIQIETWTQEQNFQSFITEKSMIALATQQIPMIIGSRSNWLQDIKDQGFDIFDDVIDQSYDLKTDYLQRIEQCIDYNYNILSGNKPLPDILYRLEKNQNYLFNEWADQTLLTLVKKIYDLLNEIN